jgi:hypothetical protein
MSGIDVTIHLRLICHEETHAFNSSMIVKDNVLYEGVYFQFPYLGTTQFPTMSTGELNGCGVKLTNNLNLQQGQESDAVPPLHRLSSWQERLTNFAHG